MAKRTYKVKAGDSFANLGYPASEVMKLNPGVPKLSQGRTIFLPGVKAGSKNQTPSTPNLGLYNSSPYLGFQTPTSSTKVNPVFAGMQVQTGATAYVPPPPVASQNPMPVMDGMTPTPSTAVTPPARVARPAGTYTGGSSASDQQWRDYWNAQAKAGKQSPAPVHIPTRDEIWRMKAAQRQKLYAAQVADQVAAQPQTLENTGNVVNTSMSWRTG